MGVPEGFGKGFVSERTKGPREADVLGGASRTKVEMEMEMEGGGNVRLESERVTDI